VTREARHRRPSEGFSWAGAARSLSGLRNWAGLLLVFGVMAPAAYGLFGNRWERAGETVFAVAGVLAILGAIHTLAGVVRGRVAAPLSGEPFRWWWVLTYATWLSYMFTLERGASTEWRIASIAFGVYLLLLGVAFVVDRRRTRGGQGSEMATAAG
jgi:vacuolar-type H+-ATPase subunit I/STV1